MLVAVYVVQTAAFLERRCGGFNLDRLIRKKWRRQTKTDERRRKEPLLLTIIPIGSARIIPFVVLYINRSISIFVHHHHLHHLHRIKRV
jgi:hypothetical protein|tara:strand:- start:2286 stop:2552 length:267 start_codon:yes stop_codon:yes gene_type:complete